MDGVNKNVQNNMHTYLLFHFFKENLTNKNLQFKKLA